MAAIDAEMPATAPVDSGIEEGDVTMSAEQPATRGTGRDNNDDNTVARELRPDEAAPSSGHTPGGMGSLSETQPHEYGDAVDVSSEESFPASDPPAWSSGTA